MKPEKEKEREDRISIRKKKKRKIKGKIFRVSRICSIGRSDRDEHSFVGEKSMEFDVDKKNP